jgi:hypothetical protein
MARRGLQIHGGVGYTKEYGAEKLLRDALVMPIYEGTSQIQSLMAMKDAMSAIMRNPQKFLTRVAQSRWRSLSALDPLERRVARLTALSLSAQQHLIQRTATDKLQEPRQAQGQRVVARAAAELGAEEGLRLRDAARRAPDPPDGDVAICEILLKQGRQHLERREVLERYLERAEPRCTFLHDEITTRGDRLLAQLHARSAGEQDPAAANKA